MILLIYNEEMEYVDGGAPSVNTVGWWINTDIWIGGVIFDIVGVYGSVKDIFKRNANGIVVRATSTLLRTIGYGAVPTAVGTIVSGLNHFMNFNLGVAIAKSWHRIDRYPNNG